MSRLKPAANQAISNLEKNLIKVKNLIKIKEENLIKIKKENLIKIKKMKDEVYISRIFFLDRAYAIYLGDEITIIGTYFS